MNLVQNLATFFRVDGADLTPAKHKAAIKGVIDSHITTLQTELDGIGDEAERAESYPAYAGIKSATGGKNFDAVIEQLRAWSGLMSPVADIDTDAADALRDSWDSERKARKPGKSANVPQMIGEDGDEDEQPKAGKSSRYQSFNINKGAPKPTLINMLEDIVAIKAGKAYKAFDYQTGPNGGFVTKHEVSQTILEPLRAQLILEKLGASVLTLPDTASITIPRMTAVPQAYWGTDGPNSTAVAETSARWGVMNLNPKPIISRFPMAKRMMSTLYPGAQDQVMRQLVQSIRLLLEKTALVGPGGIANSGDVGQSPRGLLYTTGVNSRELGSGNGAIATPQDIARMWRRIYSRDVPESDTEGLAMHPFIAGEFAEQVDAVGRPILRESWKDKEGNVIAGRRVETTTQITRTATVGSATNASYIFAGDWKYLQLALGGDLVIDIFDGDYQLGSVLQSGVVAHLYADIGVHYPQAFDILTGVLGTAAAEES